MIDTYFEKVLCLTQASRLDRQLKFRRECERVGIRRYEFFYSLDADEPYISFCKSQEALIKSAVGCSSLLAMEDDCVFKSFNHVSQAMGELPGDWDIIYFGCNPHEVIPYSQTLREVKGAWTTHCLGYSGKMIEYIANNYDSSTKIMYDAWLSDNVLPWAKGFAIYPMAAIQRPVYSDLWGQHVSYGWDEMESKLK